ncbi:MAG: hypothetical protein ACI89L_002088 [Phycisphaerales bacterium]|jgi:hypothetical protein
MSHPEVWLAIPSANAENCRRNLPGWAAQGYRIAVLQDGEPQDVPADEVVCVETYPGWPLSVAELLKRAVPKSADIIVTGGDDMLADPNLTAGEIGEQFIEHFGGTFGVMQPHGDEYKGTATYCGSPWLGREWCDRMYQGKGPLCGAYIHNWADMELYWVARGLGRLWVREDLTQYHDHFSRRGEAAPEYWTRSATRNDQRDTQMFIARAATGFPGHEVSGDGRDLGVSFDAELFASEYQDTAQRHWEMKFGRIDVPHLDLRLMRETLEACARNGQGKVVIYGAGEHTTRVGAALAEPPVEVVGIIDDNEARQGDKLWGIPIVSKAGAIARGAKAAILSSDTFEDKLWDAAEPLRAAGVVVHRLYGDQAAQSDRTHRVLLYPSFGDAAELTEGLYRAAWYLAPLLDSIETVVVPHRLDGGVPELGARPAYFDESLEPLLASVMEKVEFVPQSEIDPLGEATKADAVVVWRSIDETGTSVVIGMQRAVRPPRQQLFLVDDRDWPDASVKWLTISERLAAGQAGALAESQQKFARMAESLGSKRGYVFGTGPGLAQAMDHDFADGLTIACNSMVGNDELMAKLRPPVIVAGDPIFHAGPTTYAAEFRRHLIDAMREYGSWFVCPWRDYRLYLSVLPSDLHDRVVGVPISSDDAPNLDLRTRFEIAGTKNILTLFLLPLALTFCDEVCVAGCDGRPLDEDDYFWKHDPKTQYNEKMADVQAAHPSFFAIDYNRYYLEHCATLARWIEAGEANGKRVVNITPSYIPALLERSATGLVAAKASA